MTDVAALLPPPSTGPFERAMAAGMSDDLPVPYAQILNPYLSPVRFLPWLAVHHSVDLWFDDWPEARKREMIAQCAGVSTVYPADPPLGEMKGTLKGLKRYLEFVDATIIDRKAHPERFVFGRSPITRTPIAHEAFTAHYLIKVLLPPPANGFQIGRSAMGRSFLTVVDRTPMERVKRAMVVAKTPDTLYSVTFAWRRPVSVSDGIRSTVLTSSAATSPAPFSTAKEDYQWRASISKTQNVRNTSILRTSGFMRRMLPTKSGWTPSAIRLIGPLSPFPRSRRSP